MDRWKEEGGRERSRRRGGRETTSSEATERQTKSRPKASDAKTRIAHLGREIFFLRCKLGGEKHSQAKRYSNPGKSSHPTELDNGAQAGGSKNALPSDTWGALWKHNAH